MGFFEELKYFVSEGSLELHIFRLGGRWPNTEDFGEFFEESFVDFFVDVFVRILVVLL